MTHDAHVYRQIAWSVHLRDELRQLAGHQAGLANYYGFKITWWDTVDGVAKSIEFVCDIGNALRRVADAAVKMLVDYSERRLRESGDGPWRQRVADVIRWGKQVFEWASKLLGLAGQVVNLISAATQAAAAKAAVMLGASVTQLLADHERRKLDHAMDELWRSAEGWRRATEQAERALEQDINRLPA